MTQFPIFDGHNDTILHLITARGKGRGFFEQSDHGHLDLPRAVRGGMVGGFFAIFTPNPPPANEMEKAARMWRARADGYMTPLPPPISYTTANRLTTHALARLMQLEAESNGRVCIVRTASELEAGIAAGQFCMILHIEGAEAIDPELHALDVLYAVGLRSIGPVWSRPNAFGFGVPFDFPQSPDVGPGLTEAGKQLVARCNELGVLLDLSHLNEAGFWDVVASSNAPIVATHSNAFALCASPRNLTDAQLDAVAKSNGVVGLNYNVGFLRADGLHKPAETGVDEIARHARYIAARIGVAHLALGSDFDGATMPHDLSDAAALPNLIAALQEAGFSDAELMQITHQNWIRVLRDTWGE